MLALEIKGLRKTYKNKFEALKGVDLQVEQGDFFALLGPNGAGKSTTIGIITTLINKTAGSVVVYGHDIEKSPNKVKELIGVVSQEVNFNPFSKVYNIVYTQAGYYGISGKKAHQQTEKLLKELGLWDKKDDAARSLSGGMKRRLMIARALVHDPKFLILDEPSAGVDIELRRSMWKFLEKVNRDGTTIVLTTHYLEEAEQLCNKVAIIDKGTLIESTDTKALLQKLDVETMVLDLKQQLFEKPELGDYKGRLIDPFTLEVDICSSQNVNNLFMILSEKNIEVMSFRNKTNRLEELFLRLTH